MCAHGGTGPRASNSSHVSYLAQTRMLTPVMIHSPECVERATSANSQLSFLGPLSVSSQPIHIEATTPADWHS